MAATAKPRPASEPNQTDDDALTRALVAAADLAGDDAELRAWLLALANDRGD